jgi:oxygen-dependent protoporphyrinogen oxidase
VNVFEAANRLGGVLDTVHRDGFLIERSADNFLTKLPAAISLCRRLGIADDLQQTDEARRRALVVCHGQLMRVPDGFFMMSPRKLWPVLTTPLLSLSGKMRLLAEPFISPRDARRVQGSGFSDPEANDLNPEPRTLNPDESIASFARRRLGREVFERLVQPLVAGIYTADPEKLSMAATMSEFLAYEREHGSLLRATLQHSYDDNAHITSLRTGRFSDQLPSDSFKVSSDDHAAGPRYSLFAAPRNGMSSLVAALAARLRADAVHLNTCVTHIEQLSGNKWRIDYEQVTANPTPHSPLPTPHSPFDAVILAVPAPAAARLLAPLDAELSRELAAIPYAGCAVVSFGFARHQVAHPLDAFGFVVPHIEGRRIIAASFASLKFSGRAPADQVLIRVFVGGALRPELADLPDDELRQLALDELRDLLRITGEPLLTDIARWPASMPQYHVGHLDRVARIESLTARHPGLAFAGNAYHGVGIPQCIASGESAAEQVLPLS